MATVNLYAPGPEARAIGQQVPKRFTPGVVIAVDGPERLGPEAAGALTLLHVTFADDEDAQRGFREFAAMLPEFASLPGFIRWLTFNDGVDTYTLGLWRSVEDVMDFVRGEAHRTAARTQVDEGYEYSQFAGVWGAHAVGARTFYCPVCRAATVAPAQVCSACGEPIDDTFRRDPALTGEGA